MATLTKAQWDEVKEQLSLPYGSAYLKCDGYLVCADIRQHKMKLTIQVYVNGWINGKWWWFGKERDIDNMPEIAKRFYCLRRKRPSAKKVAADIKIFGKKFCQKNGMHAAICAATPWFSTPGSFIAHLKKHNTSIEVIDLEAYQAALGALRSAEDSSAQPDTAGADSG